MTKRLYLFAAFSLGLSSVSYNAIAQDESDAFRYSNLSTQGTARSMGFGGALGSIGGDFSSLSVNPAGIGVYRSSEFMLSPAIRLGSVDGSYVGNSMTDNNSRFTFGNIGLVLTSVPSGRRYQRADWKSVSFGIGINRVADFNRNYVYSGRDATSFSELFALDANQYPDDITNTNTFAGIGWESYLLDTANGEFFSVVDWRARPRHQKTVRERGGISEFAISLGGNYQEKLMLGATLGLPILRYSRQMSYQETDESGDLNNFFQSFEYTENLKTEGSGINLKLGAIYKPTDQFRIGLAFHTPTFYSLKDVQSRTITTNTENYKIDLGQQNTNPVTSLLSETDIPIQTFEYNLITPMRTVVSLAGIIAKSGFVTMDYEYVDHGATRFRYSFEERAAETFVNKKIKDSLQGSHIIRLGGEIKLDIIALRAGAGYYSNPFKTYSGDRLDLSVGAGLRFDSWFLDLALVNTRYNRKEQPFSLAAVPTAQGTPPVTVPYASLDNKFNTVAITFGVKF
ncbi:MAG: hypothetical protein EOP56_09160 [Sphingobacteriales bacterium]|nr:MAG: hypothetical protein EOP56_09160 [Sphingobacteriales bacterium]